MMKKQGIILAAVLLLATGCSADPAQSKTSNVDSGIRTVISADYPHYASLQALSEKADTIVKAKWLQADIKDDQGVSSTISKLQVTGVYKGNAEQGSTILFSQPGSNASMTKDADVTSTDFVLLEAEQEYILFLEKPAGATNYYLLNPYQSCYVFDANAKTTDTLHPVLAQNAADFSLTYDALSKLK